MLTSHVPQSESFGYLSALTEIFCIDHLIVNYGFADFAFFSAPVLRHPRNLGAERTAGVLLEQLGELRAHTARHRSFDWLRCMPKPWSNISLIAAMRTASLSAKPDQLFHQRRRFMAANPFRLARHDVGRAFLAAARFW